MPADQPRAGGTLTGLLDKSTAPISFEPCEPGCWDEWYATDGHHDTTPALRRKLMRAIALNYNPGEGIADMARSASIIRGWIGKIPDHVDFVACEHDGRTLTVYEDDDGNDVEHAICWWPCTWAQVADV